MQLFLANFLIALREGVEGALIIGILVAYLVKVGRKDVLPKLWLGVILAAAIPLLAGAFMTWGPYTLTFQAQEVIGGVLSLVAVGMVTWMIFWMGKNSRQLTQDLKTKAGEALAAGSAWGILWLGIISVGREGLETAIFTWATVQATQSTGAWQPVTGVLSGLAVSIVIGWLIYKGVARINLRAFFFYTGLLLIIVAAGVVSYGIGDLQEASVLPGWGTAAYDISGYFDGHIPWLSTTSMVFVLLEAIFNLNLAPTYLQVAGWVIYLAIVLPLFIAKSRAKNPQDRASISTAPTPSKG